MFRHLFKTTKFVSFFILFINIILGFTVPVNILIIKKIIDAVMNTNNYNVHNEYFYLVILLFLQLVTTFINEIYKFLKAYLNNSIEVNFGKEIFSKCLNMKYDYFERADTYPIIDRIITTYKENIGNIVDIISSILKTTISILGVFYIIYQIEWWILIVLVITSLPVWIFSIISTLKERNTYMEIYPHYLRSKYFSKVINSREYIKEARFYNYHKYINKLWLNSLREFQKGQLLSNFKPRYIAGLFIILQYIVVTVVIFMMLLPLSNKLITIGSFIAIAQAMWTFVGGFQYDIINIIQKINHLRVFIKDYKAFIEYDDINNKHCELVNSKNSFNTIIFDDVWFRYNENEEYILKGVNLTIPCNKLVALVGKNGSGKTTIIKLLLGLLYPTKGNISVDDIPLSSISAIQRKRLLSVVFQDFVKYNITLRESVGISNLDRIKNDKRIVEILSSINNYSELMKNLGSGLDTRLGKDINNSVDLSGGQWQSIAIARALFSDAACIIMDEPTASLDPIAEVQVYNQLFKATKNKTAIFVTHRLGSTKLADVIYTLEKGKIVESGSHEQLMKEGGFYAEMFNTQKKWYK